MNEQERSLIEGLFQRLQQAEAQSGPRDAEAESLIHSLVARQPGAPYLLAQVVLVQEQGLRNLQTRVEALERELAERPQGGGFLSGLFGGGQSEPATPPAPPPGRGSGWGGGRFPARGATSLQPGMSPGASGGGFMAGALQTAMGVAGGVLLGNAVAGLFAGEAAAAEAPAEPPAAAPEEPEASSSEDESGFFGGFGDSEDEAL